MACPAFFLSGFGFFGQALEPRAREVDQSLGRLLSFDPHTSFFRKREEGWGTRTTLIWASSDGL
jgi:hypothetical protein